MNGEDELDNPKHEKLARFLSEGMAQDDAYARAGFAYSKASANLLCRRPHIAERVAFLVQQQEDNLANEEMNIPSGDDIVQDVEVTRAWLLQQLSDNVLKAKRAGQYSASNRAIEMLGNFMGGMFDKPKGKDGAAVGDRSDPSSLPSINSVNAILQMAQDLKLITEEVETANRRPPRVVNPITSEDDD